MPPKVLARNNDRAGGVLPVGAAARAAPTKSTGVRLKLEIRRLPPGLTLTEFEETLGSDWRLGDGKVDWREYRQGKIKTSAGKIPEQSRCYVHLVNEALLKEFEARFFNVVFHDKAGTHRNPELRHLPPVLSYAPNQRTPLNVKVRTDNRQGTIDQDPEFIAFLEAETQPIAKPASLDAVGAEKKETEKVEITSTPLIDALREKKANKAKAAASKEEKKEAKGHSRSESKDLTNDPDKPIKEGKASHRKGDAASKDNPKAINKQIAIKQQPAARAASPQQIITKPASPAKTKKSAPSPKPPVASPASPAPAPSRPPRQRGNTDGIKKMLQKDLGIRPKPATNAANPTSPPTSKSTVTISPPNPAASPSATNKPTNARGPKGSTSSKGVPAQGTSSSIAPAGATGTANAAASAKGNVGTGSLKTTGGPAAAPSVAKAYLKHANPSQGMTEILIQQALGAHGEVANVTIDPRKGTAIAIFKNIEGLKKAIEAKKVPVANGSVEVLEFRERGAQQQQGGGGGQGGQGGGAGGQGAGAGEGGGGRAQRGGHRGRGGRGGRGGGVGKDGAAASAAASPNANGNANPKATAGTNTTVNSSANANASAEKGAEVKAKES